MKVFIITFFLVVFSFPAKANEVIIKGNAKSYSGLLLTFWCYDDQVTMSEKEIGSARVNEDGSFEFKIQLNETIHAFIHLNVFKGILYLEPGKTYEIILPQKVEKLPEDELNPYFEETEFNIKVLNASETDLNELIQKFNQLYDNELTKNFQQFRGKLNKTVADSIIDKIEKGLPANNNLFFKDYKTYSYVSLRLMAYERNKEKLTENYFTGRPILLQNPAYMDLFNQLYTNYLSDYSRTRPGKQIPYYLVKEKSLSKIRLALQETPCFKDLDFVDLIICKSLFDNFYKNDYPREDLINMIDSIKNNGSGQSKLIAANIYKRITTLLTGFPAPEIELPDVSDNMIMLSQFRGKFIYLSFINPRSYTCLQELEILKKLKAANPEMLDLVSICICDNINQMKQLVNANGYGWPFLFYSKKTEFLKLYNIHSYPTYYLINPDGNLSMSPAFPPSEPSFISRYVDILKAWKTEQERKKSKGKGTRN
ncbi:MAG: redoxin domain-containing protein [Bacteroidales bacterium]